MKRVFSQLLIGCLATVAGIGVFALFGILALVIFVKAGARGVPTPSPTVAGVAGGAEPYIVLVHGRGNQPSPNRMRECWIGSLERGVHEADNRVAVNNLPIEMVDYVDWFYPQRPPRKPFCEASDDIVRDKEENENGLPADVVKYFTLDYAHYITQPLIETLDRLHLPLKEGKSLREPNRRILVIAHSFGAIAAYDVLRTYDFRIDTLITIGSPLGYARDVLDVIPEWAQRVAEVAPLRPAAEYEKTYNEMGAIHAKNFRSPVLRELRPLGRPEDFAYPEEKVGRWINFYDLGDPVANEFIGPTLRIKGDVLHADDFLDSKNRVRVLDVQIENSRVWKHSAYGYLENERVGKVVACFLAPYKGECQDIAAYIQGSPPTSVTSGFGSLAGERPTLIPTTRTQSVLRLNPGWNVVYFQLQDRQRDLENFLTAASRVDTVLQWDSKRQAWLGSMRRAGDAIFAKLEHYPGGVQSIAPGNLYLFHVAASESVDLRPDDTPFTPVPVALSPGWHHLLMTQDFSLPTGTWGTAHSFDPATGKWSGHSFGGSIAPGFTFKRDVLYAIHIERSVFLP